MGQGQPSSQKHKVPTMVDKPKLENRTQTVNKQKFKANSRIQAQKHGQKINTKHIEMKTRNRVQIIKKT